MSTPMIGPKPLKGARVEVQDAFGRWLRATARSEPFWNSEYVPRGCAPWMVVEVDGIGYDHPINWPADNVRRAPR